MIGVTSLVTISVISLTSASSLVGNTLLILACLSKSSGKLNIFLINLCTADLLLTGYTPLLFYIMIKEPESITLQGGHILCYISNNHIVIASTLNCTTILLIAYERFVAIKDPLRYHTIMNQMRMMKMVGSCWITVIVATLVKDAIVWNFSDGPRFNKLKGYCVDEGYELIVIKVVIELIMSGLLLVVPLIITTALYCSILIKIYKTGKRFRSLRSVKSVDKAYENANGADKRNGHVLCDIMQSNKSTESQPKKQLEMQEREEVVAELRDLTRDVDVESISETVMKCKGSTNNLAVFPPLDDKQQPANRKVLRKQKTAIEIEIFSGDAFNEIIRNLKKFKDQCDEPEPLAVCKDNDYPQNRFTKSVHKKASRKSQSVCNLRKFRSVGSFEDITNTSGTFSERHYHTQLSVEFESAKHDIKDEAICEQTPREDTKNSLIALHLASEGDATMCIDNNPTKLGNYQDVPIAGEKPHSSGKGVHYGIKRKGTRRESRDNLLGKSTSSLSIKDKLHGRKNHSASVSLEDNADTGEDSRNPDKNVLSVPSNESDIMAMDAQRTKRRLTFQAVVRTSMWGRAAVTANSITAEEPVLQNCSRTRKEDVLKSKSLDQTLNGGATEHRESTDVTLNWKMLILMMRLAKLARQPTAVIQERLGTTKYQIQLVKAAVMSCVAFYVLTLPFVIITVLPCSIMEEPVLPIIILPLVNCIADFLVYGFMHPTFRSQVQTLLHKPRKLTKSWSTC